MKLLIISACLFITVTGAAQESRSVTKNIHDDGNMLKLKYQVTSAAKSIDYSNEFEVKGWSKEQKDQLVNRIIDSLESNTGKVRDYLSQHIDDDGIKMKVNIHGRRNGNVITFNKTYDVKGMTQEQKKAMIEELLKGLGLSAKN